MSESTSTWILEAWVQVRHAPRESSFPDIVSRPMMSSPKGSSARIGGSFTCGHSPLPSEFSSP